MTEIHHRALLERRQLLTIESKRVAAEKVKAELDVVRSEGAQEDLRNQWHALLRDGTRTRLSSGPVTTHAGEQTRDPWAFPDLRVAAAWKIWIEECRANGRDLQFDDVRPRPRLALLMGGGLGDLLKATTLLPALSEAMQCDVHVFYDNGIAREILRDHPNVASVTILKQNPHDFARKSLHLIPLFDLVVSWRYVINYAIPPASRLSQAARALVASGDEHGHAFAKYNLVNDLWPVFNNGFSRDMEERDLSVIDVSRLTSGLDVGPNPPILFVPTRRSLAISMPHRHRPYITVHHGYDPNFLPDRTIKTTYGSTKNVSTALWKEIVDGLTHMGFDVVQLGTTGEEVLPGVPFVYLGQTDFSETAMLIKDAVCHVDTEGGLVHVARAVHTRSVVMFGPTSMRAFGYPDNVNLQATSCHSCWFTTSNWVVQCPRATTGPQCMEEHKAETVLRAVRSVVDSHFATGFDWIASTSAPMSREDIALHGIEKPQAGQKVLLVVDPDYPIPFDRTGGVDLTVVTTVGERRHAEPEAGAKGSVGAGFASPFNLPEETEQFDLVVAATAEWVADSNGRMLREFCRVLKPGGYLDGVLTAVPSAGRPKRIDISALFEASGFQVPPDLPHPSQGSDRFRLRKRRPGTPATDPVGRAAERPWTERSPSPLVEQLQDDVFGRREDIHRSLSLVHALYARREALAADIWRLRSEIAATRGHGEGWIETSARLLDHGIENYLLENWHPHDDWQVWGEGARHSLLLPLPPGTDTHDGVEVEMVFNFPDVGDGRQRSVRVSAAGTPVAVLVWKGQMSVGCFTVPGSNLVEGHVALLEFDVGHSVTPAGTNENLRDTRSLGLGLIRLRYRRATKRLTHADAVEGPQQADRPSAVGVG